MGGAADLHLHTTFSDGALPPHDVVRTARRAGLSLLAITDHDHTGGLEEARNTGAALGIQVIAGVEVCAVHQQREIHLLGYRFDPDDVPLQETCAALRGEREQRAGEIVHKLQTLGLPVTMEAVRNCAGKAAICRPHIARALVQMKLVASMQEAFVRYLHDGGAAYVPRKETAPEDVMALIGRAGGLTFLAHPGDQVDEAGIRDLHNRGLDGIEVVHPSHTRKRTEQLRTLARTLGMLVSGGSDFHGGGRNDDTTLGKYVLPLSDAAAILDTQSHS
jgi:3',5'-nucleoside bisphosphate phosphatase